MLGEVKYNTTWKPPFTLAYFNQRDNYSLQTDLPCQPQISASSEVFDYAPSKLKHHKRVNTPSWTTGITRQSLPSLF